MNNEPPGSIDAISPSYGSLTHTWKEQIHEKFPLVRRCKSDSSAWTMAAFWTEINKSAVTTNARRSSSTCTHTLTPLTTREDDHLHSIWLKRLITSLVCVLYARLKMTRHWLAATSFSLLNTKPCYQHPSAWVIAHALDKRWVFLKSHSAVSVRFCSRTLPPRIEDTLLCVRQKSEARREWRCGVLL